MQSADVLASPGPARTTEVQLSSGHEASLVFHDRLDLLEILAPLDTGIEVGLADLLGQLHVVPDAITWTHDGIDRAAIVALQTPNLRIIRSLELTETEPPGTSVETSAPSESEVLAQFQDIFRKHYPRLVRFARSFYLPEDDAADVVQEAFLRFYQSVDTYRGDEHWPLLKTMVRSVVFNRIRARNTTKRSGTIVNIDHAEVAADSPDYAEREQTILRHKLLHDAIAALPDSQQQAVRLWLDGLNHAAIAGALGITSEAVRSRLRDAKEQLRRTVGDS